MPAGPFDDVDLAELPPPPPGLIRLAARQCRAAVPDERRRVARHPIAADLLVRPIDTSLAPAGPAFRAVATDLSTGGLRLFHTRHIPTGLLAVRLPSKRPTTVILAVRRSTALGRYYEAAGPFVTKLGFGGATAGSSVGQPPVKKLARPKASAKAGDPDLKVWKPKR